MIEKWYCLRCDFCGKTINYWNTNSKKEAIEKERKSYSLVVTFKDGRCFCCADCYKVWLDERKADKQKGGEK